MRGYFEKEVQDNIQMEYMENDVLSFSLPVDISSNHRITAFGRMSRQRRRKRRAEMRLLARQVQNEPEQMQENGSEQMLDGNNPNILVDDTENDDATTEG